MARRREFRGVAHAMLSSFISRNNDVEGYWGVGQLCRHAGGAGTVEIDLLRGEMAPAGALFDTMVAEFRQMLLKQCASHSLPIEWLRSARLVVSFGGEGSNSAEAHEETAFTCSVLLEDDARTMRQASISARCWPTNPAREYRRICDDWNRRGAKPASVGGELIG